MRVIQKPVRDRSQKGGCLFRFESICAELRRLQKQQKEIWFQLGIRPLADGETLIFPVSVDRPDQLLRPRVASKRFMAARDEFGLKALGSTIFVISTSRFCCGRWHYRKWRLGQGTQPICNGAHQCARAGGRSSARRGRSCRYARQTLGERRTDTDGYKLGTFPVPREVGGS
jgi:hypothetical protein